MGRKITSVNFDVYFSHYDLIFNLNQTIKNLYTLSSYSVISVYD